MLLYKILAYATQGNMKPSYKNNKYKASASTWNDES